MLKRSSGFTLIELMIAVVIMGVLLAIAIPSYQNWMLNLRIRNAAESVNDGLTAARNEAVRRNLNVRFQLVSSLDGGCVLSSTATNWVVSLDDPSSMCGLSPSDTTNPRIVQKRSSGEGSNSTITTTLPGGATTVTFNGLGRVVVNSDGTPTITQISFDLPTTIMSAAASRDLRVTISNPGGQVRMCDPNVTSTTDPRKC